MGYEPYTFLLKHFCTIYKSIKSIVMREMILKSILLKLVFSYNNNEPLRLSEFEIECLDELICEELRKYSGVYVFSNN